MRFENVLILCLGCVICLTPVVAYLFWLCAVTRRKRPTIFTGTGDFAILLSALSGFILFGGGLLLSLVKSNVRFAIRGNFESFKESWAVEKSMWIALSLSYLAVVIGTAVIAFRWRRRSLVIYNIEPSTFEQTVGEILDHMGRKVERRGNTWFAVEAQFQIEPFETGHTVGLRWLSEDLLLFQELERQIRHTLPSIESSENPAASWFTSAAIGGLILVAVTFILFVFMVRQG